MRVLLLGADYYGTLAAARCFGKHGVDVTMADESRQGRALFSRWVGEKLVHPKLADPEALIEWLVSWGRDHPDTLLYPPNDHLAWLFAAHRDRLGRVFAMYSPSEEAVLTLLDKKRLHDACGEVGIDVPFTTDAGAAVERYPVLIKPRTQVYLESGIKGFIAKNASELASELARYRGLVAFNAAFLAKHPEVREPMIQEYLVAAETSIFSVSGFIDEHGRIVARAAMKVLQRPRKVGIGLCFEGRPVEQELVDKLAALAKKIGYHGAFESEFIAEGDKRLLIDFNPRFYSQMGFDIGRGVALPMMVLHGARGDRQALDAWFAEAEAWRPAGDEVYCHKTMLDLVLALQGLSGEMTRDEIDRWRAWHRTHTVTDAVRDRQDRLPGVVDAALWARHFARHPRSFVRSFVLNR